MGKRSNYERKERDAYFTPYEAVLPLLPHLMPKTRFIELCAGDGRLIAHLQSHGHLCTYASDLEPQAEGIQKRDALALDFSELPEADVIITNPPWQRNRDGTGLMHEMIEKFRNHLTTWMLIDADWMFTGQARPFLKYCDMIVSVGRISWMENGMKGKDNCVWYRFQKHPCETRFINEK